MTQQILKGRGLDGNSTDVDGRSLIESYGPLVVAYLFPLVLLAVGYAHGYGGPTTNFYSHNGRRTIYGSQEGYLDWSLTVLIGFGRLVISGGAAVLATFLVSIITGKRYGNEDQT